MANEPKVQIEKNVIIIFGITLFAVMGIASILPVAYLSIEDLMDMLHLLQKLN